MTAALPASSGPDSRSALIGMVLIVPVIPIGESGWALLVPLLIAGTGLGLLVSQLNNYILGPIEEERVSEAAGVNSAGQSFGLSFGLALAGGILLAALSFNFTNQVESSDVIPPADQEVITNALEDNAQLVSDHRPGGVARGAARRGRAGDHRHQHQLPVTGHCKWRCSYRSSPACSDSRTRSG